MGINEINGGEYVDFSECLNDDTSPEKAFNEIKGTFELPQIIYVGPQTSLYKDERDNNKDEGNSNKDTASIHEMYGAYLIIRNYQLFPMFQRVVEIKRELIAFVSSKNKDGKEDNMTQMKKKRLKEIKDWISGLSNENGIDSQDIAEMGSLWGQANLAKAHQNNEKFMEKLGISPAIDHKKEALEALS